MNKLAILDTLPLTLFFMKWNDIVTHMKKNKTVPASVTDSPRTSSVSATTTEHDRVHTWISMLAIILALIIIVTAALWIFRSRHPQETRLTDKDVQVVNQFFDENPPAELTTQDFDYLKNALTGEEVQTVPASTKTGKAK
jgi:hypothetical protein